MVTLDTSHVTGDTLYVIYYDTGEHAFIRKNVVGVDERGLLILQSAGYVELSGVENPDNGYTV